MLVFGRETCGGVCGTVGRPAGTGLGRETGRNGEGGRRLRKRKCELREEVRWRTVCEGGRILTGGTAVPGAMLPSWQNRAFGHAAIILRKRLVTRDLRNTRGCRHVCCFDQGHVKMLSQAGRCDRSLF